VGVSSAEYLSVGVPLISFVTIPVYQKIAGGRGIIRDILYSLILNFPIEGQEWIFNFNLGN
jgi:hypothetical protein